MLEYRITGQGPSRCSSFTLVENTLLCGEMAIRWYFFPQFASDINMGSAASKIL